MFFVNRCTITKALVALGIKSFINKGKQVVNSFRCGSEMVLGACSFESSSSPEFNLLNTYYVLDTEALAFHLEDHLIIGFMTFSKPWLSLSVAFYLKKL